MSGQIFHILRLLLEICQQASTGLPLIIVLSLAAGRRGRGRFFLEASRASLAFCICLACCGIFYFPAAYLGEILSFGQEAGNIWAPFFQPPGLPWSASMGAQILGLVLLACARFSLPANIGEKYSLGDLKTPLVFCLAAAITFGGTCFLIDWPFAGYPPGLSGERVFFAVLKNSARHYFITLCPAGALALIWIVLNRAFNPGKPEKIIACRWTAAWAFAGYLPWLLQSWAILIGLSLRGDLGGMPPNYLGSHVVALALLSLALSLWLCQTLSKKLLPWAAFAALAFYIAFKWLP